MELEEWEDLLSRVEAQLGPRDDPDYERWLDERQWDTQHRDPIDYDMERLEDQADDSQAEMERRIQ